MTETEKAQLLQALIGSPFHEKLRDHFMADEVCMAELETALKKCAVHVRQEPDIGNPPEYLYVRHCHLCMRESDESDDMDELKPVAHDESCLLYEPCRAYLVQEISLPEREG